MPRRKTADHAATPATPTPPAERAHLVIHPDAVFLTDELRRLLRLKESSLRREVREGRLVVHKRCNRHFFLGADVLAWLRAGELKRRSGEAA